MNTHKLSLAVTTLLASTLLRALAEPAADASFESASALKVFLVDDQTGEELARDHGIHSLNTVDLEILINGVFQSGQPVRLFHQAVDEDASDNALAEMVFMPFVGPPRPSAPPPTLPVRVLTQKKAKWKQDRADWQRELLKYRKEVVSLAENFVHKVEDTQIAVAERFDRMLAERQGMDFNRSDILGGVTTANSKLGKTGRRVLILNTDCDDRPAKRRPRVEPLRDSELDPGIEIIFVNTSRQPEQAPMFRGVKNATRHANSMREAVERLVAMLEEGKPRELNSTAAHTPFK